MPIYTPRLMICPAMPGDGKILNAAIIDSFEILHKTMAWATHKPTTQESESIVCKAYDNWIARKEYLFLVFERTNNILIGACGFHSIDWNIPKAATGYWLRTGYTGQGYATEYMNALTRYAFEVLALLRLEITCDIHNKRSIALAQRLNFTQEACLKNDRRQYDGTLSDTLVFARYTLKNIPALNTDW